MSFPKMQPKVLFAEYANFLAVVLVASAFCLEAFAFSQTKYGTFNGRDWSTKLNVSTFSVSGSIGYNGTNNDRVMVHHAVVSDWGYYVDNDFGKRIANFYCGPSGERIERATAEYYINNTLIKAYNNVTP